MRNVGDITGWAYIFFRALSCILIGVVLASCGKSSVANPSVLILSVESLRRDHLSCYGYNRPTTPNIDRLAEGGVLFERAYAQCSWTKPSVASTFTSTYFSYHKLTNPYDDKNSESGDGGKHFPILRDGFTTIASFFKSKGYKCFGWTNNGQLWGGVGFGRGFIEYDTQTRGDEATAQRAISVISTEKKPWLVFVHLMAPHWDYNPPLKFRSFDAYPTGVPINGNNWREICDGKIKLSRKDLDHNVALYDGEIAYADDIVGRMIDAIEKSPNKGRVVVVVMSDHGEEFMEHGGVGHGRSLYEEVIRVPLVFWGANVPGGKRVDALVQNADVFPTLAAICGFDPPRELQGMSLYPFFRNKSATIPRRFVYSETETLHAVVGVNFKYLFDLTNGREEFYDLERDPKETTNIVKIPEYGRYRDPIALHAREWLSKNETLSARMGKPKTINVSPDTINSLRTLGYIK